MKITINKNEPTEKSYFINNVREQYYPEMDEYHLTISIPHEPGIMDDIRDFIQRIKINKITVYNNNNKQIYETNAFNEIINFNHTVIDGFANDVIYLELRKQE